MCVLVKDNTFNPGREYLIGRCFFAHMAGDSQGVDGGMIALNLPSVC